MSKISWINRALAKSSRNDSGCLEFNGSINQGGYGLLHYDGKIRQIHRISYGYFKENVPEGLVVRHTCDNRKCWNPQHLLLGTQKDNMRDRDERNRGKIPDNKGSLHGMSKLTEDQVKEIKVLIENGLTNTKIGIDYNVNPKTISDIKIGKAWKHVRNG